MQRRSRRTRVSKAKLALSSALSELSATRSGQASRIEQFHLEEEEDVYDEVSEEKYREMVKSRRKEEVCAPRTHVPTFTPTPKLRARAALQVAN